ncbi:MAG: aspartate kinase [Candidatus Hadarchaeales archaeon]
MRTISVKFGGTSVGNVERVLLCARAVEREYRRGNRVAVVVSAMGHTTDALIEAAKRCGVADRKDLDFIMALGERSSVRVFSAALQRLGVPSEFIDPRDGRWPVITDDGFGSANIDIEETVRRTRKYIVPLLRRGIVPVICGFLGRTRSGDITTIGRGGSDITGFVVGKCIGADETIIVSDVDGVMTTDPNIVSEAKILPKITVEELRDLARFGAKVMHPRAMNYKDPKIKAKVIHFRHGNLSAEGTVIVGPKENEAEGVELYGKMLSMLTVVGEEMQRTPGILTKVATPLSRAGVNIFGVSIGPRSFSVYVSGEDAERALKLVHGVVVRDRHMKAVTSEDGLAMITAQSEKFIYTPGVIAKLTEPVARAGINIVEILSSRASISFFVKWEDRERALKLFREGMMKV